MLSDTYTIKMYTFSGNHYTDQNSIYGLSDAKLISKTQLAVHHVLIPFMSNNWACVQQLLLPSAKLNNFNLIDILARQESFLCKHYYHLIAGFLSQSKRFV